MRSVPRRVLWQLRDVLLGGPPSRESVPIGVPAFQHDVTVELTGLDRPMDVTTNLAGAALRPLSLAIAFPEGPLNFRHAPRLTFRDARDGFELGTLTLTEQRALRLSSGERLVVFETSGSTNHCIPQHQLQAHNLYRRYQLVRRKNRHAVTMDARDLPRCAVFYCRPWPVFMVTVREGDGTNVFPMDIMGTVGAGHFALALRTTAPAVAQMKRTRKIVLAAIPLDFKTLAYELGHHHRVDRIVVEDLPFPTCPSPTWGYPVPTRALYVREVEVEQSETVGSHTVFITRTRALSPVKGGLQLHHVHEFYGRYLRSRGREVVESADHTSF